MEMVYGVDPEDTETYLKYWADFIVRWNELLPEVPLYSNIFYTVFIDNLKDYEEGPFWGFGDAVVYAHLELDQ